MYLLSILCLALPSGVPQESISHAQDGGTAALVKQLADADPEVRAKAAKEMRKLVSPPPEAAAPLTSLFKDGDGDVDCAAIDALLRIGAPAVPSLISALQRADHPRARRNAEFVLERLGAKAAAGLPQLEALLGHDNPDVRISVIRVLSAYGEFADPKPLIKVVQNDPDFDVRRVAVLGFGNFRKRGAPAIPVLIDVMLSEESGPFLASDASVSLACIGEPAVAALAEIIISPKIGTMSKHSAIHALDKMRMIYDPNGVKKAVPALLEVLKSRELAWRAANLLGNLGDHAQRAVPLLKEFLKDQSYSGTDRVIFAVSLLKLDPNNSVSNPVLIDGLRSGDHQIRSLAASRLEEISSRMTSAIPVLIELCTDPERDVRMLAASALGSFGPAAKSAIPALERLTKDEDQSVRNNARIAIENISRRTDGPSPQSRPNKPMRDRQGKTPG
jgi:HEAT repeat protein